MNELPTNWRTEPLGRYLTAAQYGLSVRGQQSGRFPILRMNCQVNGRVRFDNLQFVDIDEDTFESFRLRRGDILFNRTNSIELVGRTAIFKTDREAVFASYLLRLACDTNSVCPDFLNYYLNKSETQAELKTLAGRGVSQANINATKLKDFEIVLPPKPEQERIAAVLWKVQRAIEVEDKLIATARELKQSAMRQLFTRGLRGEAQKETDIGPAPESWEVSPIRANAKLIAGGTPSRSNNEYWEGGTIPWVKTGEVDYCVITDTEERITPAGMENSAAKMLPKGTLLIAMYGQGITRGKVAILGIDATANQACAGIIPINEKVLPLYLYYFLTFSYDRLRTLSHGAQQQNLNAELVARFHVAVPDKEEQHEIVGILQTIDRKISVHERKRATLQELFKTLLHQLMTGQIRVHNLDIDVSEIQTP